MQTDRFSLQASFLIKQELFLVYGNKVMASKPVGVFPAFSFFR